jgi:biotin synthase
MNGSEVLDWLKEDDPNCLETLWSLADATRRSRVGDAVHIRGLIEFSNHCRNHCHYCGLRAGRKSLARYRMTREEIVEAAKEAERRGYGTVVLQSGEDPGLEVGRLAEVIRIIKRETPLAVTLSIGVRSEKELYRLRAAGADRYYLRFETSDRTLWQHVHPARKEDTRHRLDILPRIRELGYETGSGIIVGIPGQTWTSVVEDIGWFQRLDLDMIGCGPYVPHPETPSGEKFAMQVVSDLHAEQVPGTNLMAFKVMALTRLMCPDVNIPSTTALATLSREDGYRLGLLRGGNVLMVNLTPLKYRGLYEIYPAKAGISEPPQLQLERVEALLSSLGRTVGRGPGASLNYETRRKAPALRIAR